MLIEGNLEFPSIGGQLKNAVLQQLSSNPTITTTGRIYFNTSEKRAKIWDGTGWQEISTAATIPYSAGDGLRLDVSNRFHVNLKDDIANVSGLDFSSGYLTLKVISTEFDLDGDGLSIKTGGITNEHLAGGIADSKLQQITTASKVAASAVEDKFLRNDGNDVTTGIITMEAARLYPQATPPAGLAGNLYYNSGDDKLYYHNGTTYYELYTSSASVSSATGVAPITVSPTTGAVVVSISKADASTDGYLDNADFSIFDAKQAPLSFGAGIKQYKIDVTLGTSAPDNNFRYDVNSQQVAQGITPVETGAYGSVVLYLKRSSAALSGTITCLIKTDDGSGNPSATVATSVTVDASTLTTSFAPITFNFRNSYNLTASTQYHIVLQSTVALNTTNYIKIQCFSTAAYAGGVLKAYDGATWGSLTAVAKFIAYTNILKVDLVDSNSALKFDTSTQAGKLELNLHPDGSIVIDPVTGGIKLGSLTTGIGWQGLYNTDATRPAPVVKLDPGGSVEFQNNDTTTALKVTDGDVNTSQVDVSNLNVYGDLHVQGDESQLYTTQLYVRDKYFTLNHGVSVVPSPTDVYGMEVNRHTLPTVGIRYNEATTQWEFTNDGSSWLSLGSQYFGLSGGSALFLNDPSVSFVVGGNIITNSKLGLLETGASPQYYTYLQAGDQSGDLTWTLPTAYPGSDGLLLASSVNGTLYWSAGISGTSGYSGHSGYSGYSGLNGQGGGYFATFTNGDLVTGKMIVQHNLGYYPCPVAIEDNNGVVIYPDDITHYNGNSFLMDLTTYGTITGTWKVGVMSGGGVSGYSGYSGYSGPAGVGTSGYSGYSSMSGFSGYSGYSGRSGYSGHSGYSGYSGYSGLDGIGGGYFLGFSDADLTAGKIQINHNLGRSACPVSIVDNNGYVIAPDNIMQYDGNSLQIDFTSFGTITGNWNLSVMSGGGGAITGELKIWPTAVAPVGWLLCYGQTVSQATYPALYTTIGTTFGSGGAGTFNIPDMRGRVPVGKDNMGGTPANRITDAQADTIGGSAGTEAMAYHNHTYVWRGGGVTQSHVTQAGGNQSEPSSISDNTGYAGTVGATNIPPFLTLNYIIKT